MMVAVGGLLFGSDTGTIGPMTTMKSFSDSFGHLSASKHGSVVSSILLPAAFASLFAGNLADVYGRTRIIVIGAIIFGIGASLQATAFQLSQFILGRVIEGFGEGLFLATLTVYICEITPANRRGPLASLVQFAVTVGSATGYFISYGSSRLSSSSASWRVPPVYQAVLAFIFGLACSRIPHSPRWLLRQGHIAEAQAVLQQLGVDPAEFVDVVEQSPENVDRDTQNGLISNIKGSLGDYKAAFSKAAWKQTSLACFMGLAQQLSGIDGVLYYAPLLFQQAGLASEQASFLASGVSSLVMLAVTIPASIYSDKWGRRTSTIVGGILLTTCMLLIGSLYASNSVHGTYGAARWVVIVTIYVFAASFCATWAIGFKIYATEIQPRATRAVASSLAQSANWIANYTVALTTPILLASSSFGAYFFFGFFTLLAVIVCSLYMPETRGLGLESIESAFKDHPRPISLDRLRRRRPHQVEI